MRTGNNYTGARWTHSQRPRRVLTPVEITSRYPAFRTGQMEAWTARSTDGLWLYERIETTGTPWEVTHVPTGQVVQTWFTSLASARSATASGTAARYLKEKEA